MEITTIDGFTAYCERIHTRTRRIVALTPPEHIEWTHLEGKFTVGDLARHIAATKRYMFAANVAGERSRYAGCGTDVAHGFEAVMDFVDRMHDESMAIFRSLDDAALHGKCETPAGAPITAWKWLRAMIEHEVHHRGQIYLMLAQLGVTTPPLYGLTEAQVIANSDPRL